MTRAEQPGWTPAEIAERNSDLRPEREPLSEDEAYDIRRQRDSEPDGDPYEERKIRESERLPAPQPADQDDQK